MPCHTAVTPLEFVFPEQSYSSLHSRQSLAWDHIRGNLNDPCGVIADFGGVIADPCGVVAIPEAMPIIARLAKHHKTLSIVKHHETHVKHLWYIVKHREPLVKHHEPLVKHHETPLKHCETSWNTRHSIRRHRRSVRRHQRSARQLRGVFGDIGDCGVRVTPQMCNRVTNHGDMSNFFQTCRVRDSEVSSSNPGPRARSNSYYPQRISYKTLVFN